MAMSPAASVVCACIEAEDRNRNKKQEVVFRRILIALYIDWIKGLLLLDPNRCTMITGYFYLVNAGMYLGWC